MKYIVKQKKSILQQHKKAQIKTGGHTACIPKAWRKVFYLEAGLTGPKNSFLVLLSTSIKKIVSGFLSPGILAAKKLCIFDRKILSAKKNSSWFCDYRRQSCWLLKI